MLLPTVEVVVAYVAPEIVETQEEIVERVSREMDFDPQIVHNVINAETGNTWDCTLKGKAGELGCLQIIPRYHPNVDPLNFEDSVRYFITEYQAGRGYFWTSANCYAYLSLFVDLPRMAQILPNTTPSVGAVAIFQYKLKHVALIEKLTPDGFWVKEANFEPGKIGKRFVKWDDPAIRGFWKPTTSLALR